MEKSSSLKSKIVFFGTPHFAAGILRYLGSHGVPIVGVVTQPDRPRGRSLGVAPSPVKEVSLEILPDIPIFQPEKASEETFLQQISLLQADLFVVVAYGQILSQKLLSIPHLGCINVHASLLPKYRGAAPMQRCLMAGDKETGVAIQKMVKQLDAGDVIQSTKIKIPPEMNLGELELHLREVSKPLLLEVLKAFDFGIPNAAPQDHALATYAPKIAPEEGEICWRESAEKIHNLIRAFSPRPGAWVWLEPKSKKMKILRAQWVEGQKGVPGHMISKEGVIACGKGALRVIEVQPEGKKPMVWADWLRGASGFSCFPVQ
jgi:methionyl-tRNA formyltransferase